MKRVSRRMATVFFVFVLLVGLSMPVSAAETKPVHYLSLGDSLAAGQYPDQSFGMGYSEWITAYLEANETLGSSSKEFAKSGYTTEQILNEIGTKPEVQAAIKKADIISISAGANDLFRKLINLQKGMVVTDAAIIQATIEAASNNYIEILQTIKSLNKDAKVFVLGYYFPFPSLTENEEYKQVVPVLANIAAAMNKAVSDLALEQGVVFVPLYDQFGGLDSKKYVPNPADVHPNAEGYQAIGEALIEAIEGALAPTPDHGAAMPVDIKGHWAEKELQYALTAKLLPIDSQGLAYPDKAITRAEAAQLLYGAIPMTQEIPPNPGFKDIGENHPVYMAIAKLTALGVFSKTETFKPDDPLTRIQMAKVVASIFGLKAAGTSIAFKDVPKSYWGYHHVQAVSTHRIMIGNKNGRFDLHTPTTRAQATVVAVRALQAKQN